MLKVKELLKFKGKKLWSIHPQATILNALQLMSNKDVGALPVIDEMGLVGIISERDFLHMTAKAKHLDLDSTISQYMTKKVITTTPDTTLEECMQIMTENYIRHLPVMEDNQLIGLVSIGDVVRACVESRDQKINQLEDYIEGRGYNR
ncbi:MAG: histidine kinase [Anaerolineaceae bacterium]|nr:histidine kinase [Anaerolineaceae bacterium]